MPILTLCWLAKLEDIGDFQDSYTIYKQLLPLKHPDSYSIPQHCHWQLS